MHIQTDVSIYSSICLDKYIDRWMDGWMNGYMYLGTIRKAYSVINTASQVKIAVFGQ